MLLCVRAELEHRVGEIAAAHATMDEAEAIAGRVGAGEGSELGRKIAKLHQAFATKQSEVANLSLPKTP
jgi:hypothetical protein